MWLNTGNLQMVLQNITLQMLQNGRWYKMVQNIKKRYGYKMVTVTKRYVLQNGNHYYGLRGRLL